MVAGKTPSACAGRACRRCGWLVSSAWQGYDTRHIRIHEVRLKAISTQSRGGNGQQAPKVNWEFQASHALLVASETVMERRLWWQPVAETRAAVARHMSMP